MRYILKNQGSVASSQGSYTSLVVSRDNSTILSIVVLDCGAGILWIRSLYMYVCIDTKVLLVSNRLSLYVDYFVWTYKYLPHSGTIDWAVSLSSHTIESETLTFTMYAPKC